MTSIDCRAIARSWLHMAGLVAACWGCTRAAGQEFLPVAATASDALPLPAPVAPLESECPGGVCTIPTDFPMTALPATELPAAGESAEAPFADATPVADPLQHALTPPRSARAARQPLTWQQMTRDPLTTALLSVGLVVAGYFAVRLLFQSRRSAAPPRQPGQVLEIVGQVPLGPRHQLQLVKLATRLVLVSVSPQGTETLAEITDPIEVDQILEACQSGGPSLAGALDRLSRRHTQRGRDANSPPRTAPRAVFEA